MFSLRRFHREDVTALRCGDFVRFNVLHQSRTGMIVRLRYRGRISAIEFGRPQRDGAPSPVTGLVTDPHGIVQAFTLNTSDTVRKRAATRAPSLRAQPDRATAQ